MNRFAICCYFKLNNYFEEKNNWYPCVISWQFAFAIFYQNRHSCIISWQFTFAIFYQNSLKKILRICCLCSATRNCGSVVSRSHQIKKLIPLGMDWTYIVRASHQHKAGPLMEFPGGKEKGKAKKHLVTQPRHHEDRPNLGTAGATGPRPSWLERPCWWLMPQELL